MLEGYFYRSMCAQKRRALLARHRSSHAHRFFREQRLKKTRRSDSLVCTENLTPLAYEITTTRRWPRSKLSVSITPDAGSG